MQSLTPDLTVADVRRSVAFYRDTLGFTTQMSMTDGTGAPNWATIQRGEVYIMLGLPTDTPYPATPGAGAIFYYSVDADEDIDALYAQVQASGSPISKEIDDMFWGDRVFGVKDPDGYEIHVCKKIGEGDFSAFTMQMGEEAVATVG